MNGPSLLQAVYGSPAQAPEFMSDAALAGEILTLAAMGTDPARLTELQAVAKERFNPDKP